MFPKEFEAYDGRTYVLSEETYRRHIVPNHGEVIGRFEDIRATLEEPEMEAKSRYDSDRKLVYRGWGRGINPYLCVVVDEKASKVVTAYGTSRPKPHAERVS